MARRILTVVAWGLAGLAIAGGLIAGAFALAGEDIGDPATPAPPSASPTRGPDADDRTRSPKPEETQTRTAEPGDDHGGDGEDPGDDHGGSTESGDDDSSNSGSGSDNSGSDDSGSGSDDSGSGSDDSGSGSEDSGSGSDDSGSGSDDHGDD